MFTSCRVMPQRLALPCAYVWALVAIFHINHSPTSHSTRLLLLYSTSTSTSTLLYSPTSQIFLARTSHPLQELGNGRQRVRWLSPLKFLQHNGAGWRPVLQNLFWLTGLPWKLLDGPCIFPGPHQLLTAPVPKIIYCRWIQLQVITSLLC